MLHVASQLATGVSVASSLATTSQPPTSATSVAAPALATARHRPASQPIAAAALPAATAADVRLGARVQPEARRHSLAH